MRLCAQRRVASWGVAPWGSTGRQPGCRGAQRRVASWGVAHLPSRRPSISQACAQRRVASWGVARSGSVAIAVASVCSTPGGVVGGGTGLRGCRPKRLIVLNAGWRRGGWHRGPFARPTLDRCAQRRVASWGVARPDPPIERVRVMRAQRRVASWGVAPDPLPTVRTSLAGAQRRVASWGVARHRDCQAPHPRFVLNAGWRRGGWHHPRVPDRVQRLPVLNAGWRRGGWHRGHARNRR